MVAITTVKLIQLLHTRKSNAQGEFGKNIKLGTYTNAIDFNMGFILLLLSLQRSKSKI